MAEKEPSAENKNSCDPASPPIEVKSQPTERIFQIKHIQRLEHRIRELENSVLLLQFPSAFDIAPGLHDGDKHGGQDDYFGARTGRRNDTSVPRPKVFKASDIGFWHRLEGDDIYAIETVVYDDNQDGAAMSAFKTAMKEMDPQDASNYFLANKSAANSSTPWGVRINSKVILDALRDFNTDLPKDVTSLVWYLPFATLVESHDQMNEFLDSLHKRTDPPAEQCKTGHDGVNVEEAISQMTCYVQFMEAEVLPVVEKLNSAQPVTKVWFSDLFHIFRDDEDFYYPAGSQLRSGDTLQLQPLWRLVPRTGFQPAQDDKDSETLVLSFYSLDFDGSAYIPVAQHIHFSFFDGQREVTSLPIYPLRFAHNAEQILSECQSAGRRFLNALEQKHMAYHGWALQHHGGASCERRFVSSDVIIDCDETFKAHPDWRPSPISEDYLAGQPSFKEERDHPTAPMVWSETINRDKLCGFPRREWASAQYSPFRETEAYLKKQAFFGQYRKRQWTKTHPQNEVHQIQDDDLILLPRRLFAYSLQDRAFISLDITNLKPLEDINDPFRDLIISPNHKSIIWSLVHSHFEKKRLENSRSFFDISQDLIHNKGRGLVVLLHGVPGVGKTSTAEAVAHKWKKPLLAITCGDLGLAASDVERSLKEIFRLAQLWDCVLLLDEADVFLSQRLPSDLQRNSLVSVFLRVLEYYSGILFLTTNRVGNMDEAFKSRIHISLYYPPLTLTQTKKIWQMNLNRLQAIEDQRQKATGKPKLTIANTDILSFAVENYETNKPNKIWNGRQIRNAFLTAAALARYEQHSPKDQQQREHPHDIWRKHFETVAKASSGFDEYLRETRGKSDADLARYAGARADHFTNPNPLPSPSVVSDRSNPYSPLGYHNISPGQYQSINQEPRTEPAPTDPRLSPYHISDQTGNMRGQYQYISHAQARQSVSSDLSSPQYTIPHRSVGRGTSNMPDFGGPHYGGEANYQRDYKPKTPQPFSPQYSGLDQPSSIIPRRGLDVQVDEFEYQDEEELGQLK
ncbi:hypothetical protein BJY04DRAFT_220168 [Aspergillus karnatakaensis]|uniref:ATP-binding protein n=1 Tax=Aspergillus karnatakaensis TaxID=1810916 RepID=UPI003CCD2030